MSNYKYCDLSLSPSEIVAEHQKTAIPIAAMAKKYKTSQWMIRRCFQMENYVPIRHKVKELSEVERVWIAAVIDCEGMLTVHLPHGYVQPYSRVAMTVENIPKRLQQLCGGAYLEHAPRKGSRKKGVYQWHLTSGGLRVLLPQIVDYMMVKRRHAEIIMEILRDNRRGNRMDINKLSGLVAEIRSLNLRGFVATSTRIEYKEYRRKEASFLLDPNQYHGALPEWGQPTKVEVV